MKKTLLTIVAAFAIIGLSIILVPNSAQANDNCTVTIKIETTCGIFYEDFPCNTTVEEAQKAANAYQELCDTPKLNPIE